VARNPTQLERKTWLENPTQLKRKRGSKTQRSSNANAARKPNAGRRQTWLDNTTQLEGKRGSKTQRSSNANVARNERRCSRFFYPNNILERRRCSRFFYPNSRFDLPRRPCQGLENGEGVINKAAPAIGANLVISFCPNIKQTCDTQCVVTNDNCGLSVRAKSTRNSKIQDVLSRAPHPRFSSQICATNR
jgi:hypothetical protein